MKNEKLEFSGETKRLDTFLKGAYPDYSREFIKKMINAGSVTVNGKAAKPAQELREKDLVEISGQGLGETGVKLKDIIIYEDASLLVINKPAGLLVHPTDSNWTRDLKSLEIFKDTLASMLHAEMGSKFGEGVDRLGLVHRLDRETSGLMVIAKTLKAQENLLEQFRDRFVGKTYLGMVHGRPDKDLIVIDAPIGRESGDKRLKVWEYGREAVTEIKLLKTNGEYSYLEISPKTGRTNQIRVHLSYANMPIVGDRIYSKSEAVSRASGTCGAGGAVPAGRLMLHAFKLSFLHPVTGKKTAFKAEPDAQFKKTLKDLLKPTN